MSKIIVFAFPVFLLCIALEFWWDQRQARLKGLPSRFGLSDSLNSLSLGLMSQLTGVLSKFIGLLLYAAVFDYIALFPDADLWKQPVGWLLALVIYDFCYYWLHRGGHRMAILWAAHGVHHQSQYYNLTTALRQTSTGAFLGWIFYLPMAILGVPPLLFGIVALVDLLYQFWVHTEHVKKLGWFDRVFCSPSNHRVHHAINEGYLDRNYGGILVVWDQWFGTFTPEQETCVYGTRDPLNSWNPLWANTQGYVRLAQTSFHLPSWADKFKVWFKPPGWLPASAATLGKPEFQMAQIRTYKPHRTPGQHAFASLQLVLILFAGAAFLWEADALPLQTAAVFCVGLCASLWVLGRYTDGQLRGWQAALLHVATATALALAQ
jgi:sterol desaturase/sphingolipid hydroxylase (fatty acid hydroxylase superfamily)